VRPSQLQACGGGWPLGAKTCRSCDSLLPFGWRPGLTVVRACTRQQGAASGGCGFTNRKNSDKPPSGTSSVLRPSEPFTSVQVAGVNDVVRWSRMPGPPSQVRINRPGARSPLNRSSEVTANSNAPISTAAPGGLGTPRRSRQTNAETSAPTLMHGLVWLNAKLPVPWDELGTSCPPELVEYPIVKLKVMSHRRLLELKRILREARAHQGLRRPRQNRRHPL
jgi:hypothetical protein